MPPPRKTAKKPAKKPVKKGHEEGRAQEVRTRRDRGEGGRGRAGLRLHRAASGREKAIASKLDDIVAKNVPGVKRAMKWNAPFYGLEGKGWFCAVAAFANHTSVNFFRGVKLKPVPPDGGVKENRRVVYKTLADVDEAQLTSWVRQAAALPGWLAPPSRGGA
jgi:hypothetical protein